MKRDRLPKTLADAPPLDRADDHRTDLTDAEREVRMCVAFHEATHFVAACRLGLPIFNAFVRVPRKQPSASFPWVGGSVVAAGTLMQDAVSAASAVLAHVCLTTDEAEVFRACKSDIAVVETWANWTGDSYTGPLEPLSRDDKYKFLDGVLLMVKREWKVIDAVAACLLHCSDSTGVLSTSLTARLTKLVSGTSANICRSPEFAGPAALCERLGIDGPQIQVIRDYPFVRLSAPPDYSSPFLPPA